MVFLLGYYGAGYGCGYLYMTGCALANYCWLGLATGAPLFVPLINTSGGGSLCPAADALTCWYFEVEVLARSC